MAIAIDVPSGDAGGDGPVVEEYPEQVQGQPPPDDVAARTYFLLRWSMPVMLVWLAVAMGWEWFSVWLADDMAYPMTSISAYYYTSAQPVFVGVLIGLGVLLIVIQGRTPWEDALMNTAGGLAPFVALFPTPVDAAKDCTEAYCTSVILQASSPDGLIPNNRELIEFNVVAVAPIWAILAGYLGYLAWRAREANGADRAAPIVGAAAVFGFGAGALALWLWTDRDWFFKWAHLTSAGVMVGLLLLSIIPFALWARPSSHGFFDIQVFGRRPFKFLRNGFFVYLALAVLLLAACVLIIFMKPDDWNHKVLVIEAAALVPFAVYWVMQGFALRTHDRHTD